MESKFFNKEIFTDNNEDIIATTFDYQNNHLTLKSYLLNDKKNIDLLSYDKLINIKNINEDNHEVSIFCDIKNFEKYLKPIINNFEFGFFDELNKNINQDVFILNSNKDWLITFEKNTEDEFNLSAFNTVSYTHLTLPTISSV